MPTPTPEPAPVPLQPTPVHAPTLQEKIYAFAKSSIGQHLSLNQNIPPDLGCAEAVSVVLINAGLNTIPAKGFEGTAALYQWLQKNFDAVDNPTAGCVIISPTGTSSSGAPHGHVGIVGNFGILSNDSNTGLWLENYTLDGWNQLFKNHLGFPVLFYQPRADGG